MIITIEGKPSSGKSLLAEQICFGKNFKIIPEYNLSQCFWTNYLGVNEETEFIIVDDVKEYDKTYYLFKPDFLWIMERGKKDFKIKMPTIILIKY
jgi:hypothetical protein